MSKDTDGKLTKDEWLNVLVQANIQNSEWVRITFTFSYFSLSLFHSLHFFSFSLGAGQRTKLWRSMLHFHTCILRIFAFLPKFGNSSILEELCHASWQFGFLRIKSCIAGIFNLIILTTDSSKMIIMFFQSYLNQILQGWGREDVCQLLRQGEWTIMQESSHVSVVL